MDNTKLSKMKNIIVILLLASLSGCYSKKDPLKTGLEGKALPAFKMLLPDSITYINPSMSPSSQPVVLFYFSPECPYCRAQMDEIINSISSMKNIRFYVFTTWPFPEMRHFYNDFKLKKYPNITAGVDYNNFFKHYFKTQGVPYMAIYGKDKLLNEVFLGNVHSRQIKEVAEN